MSASPPPSNNGQLPQSADATPLSPTSTKLDPNNRRSSFNFLRRQKSNEAGSKPGMNYSKKKGYQHPPQQPVPRVPPQLPTPAPLPTMDSFGGENARHYNNMHYGNQGAQGFDFASPPHGSASSPLYGVPMPPMPSGATQVQGGSFVDPYARTESMTHRGRYSYASSAISATGINSPRRVRRRKDPTPFNILVIGAQNSGKTSFIDFLRNALSSKLNSQREKTPSPPRTALAPDSPFSPHYLETEVDHERIGVTLWDSQGLEKKFVDLQLREMSAFLESKFEETFTEEQKVVRAPGVRDTHIHCVFLILDPSRLDSNLGRTRKSHSPSSRFEEPLKLMGILDEDLDVQVLKTLQGKTTVIPVISKADTITANHMSMLKRAVWDSLKQAKLDPLEALTLGSDDDDSDDRLDERDEDAALHDDLYRDPSDLLNDLIDPSDSSDEGNDSSANTSSNPPLASLPHRRSPSGLSARLSQAAINDSNSESPYLPLSIISPDSYEPGVIGRRFPWGFADPYNKQHCDFVRLKESVFSEWRAELREASREVWYEGWRTSRLKRRGNTSAGGKGSIMNGSRNGTGVSNSGSPYGGPVGHAGNVPMRGASNSVTGGSSIASGYSSPLASPPPNSSAGRAAKVPLPNPGSPEMVKGAYRQGVNAF